MELQGTGVHIIMSAKTAIGLGAPIRGVLAFTSTSTCVRDDIDSYQYSLMCVCSDEAGRSVPAPGRGALTIGRQVPSKHALPILDIAYRSRQLSFRRTQISEWLSHEHSELREQFELQKSEGEPIDDEYLLSQVSDIEKEAKRQEKEALAMYGILEGADPRTVPLRRALAVWGLAADDVGTLSIHGTSSGANVGIPISKDEKITDGCIQAKNETKIWNDIFTTIAHTPGNAVPIMAQKSLLGHSKRGSAAWQTMGLLQSASTGIIPGNHNNE
jgi:fatty acid synthase subunit beta